MKSVHILLASLALAGTAPAFDQPKVNDMKPNERVLVLGDSTTYDGTCVAGYVRLVDQGIQEQIPDRKAAVRSFAWPGVCLVPEAHLVAKRQPFADQWKAALTQPNAPTTVMINLGLNDSKGGEANVPTYEKWVRQYVEELRVAKMNVVLCTPTLWGGLKQTKSYAEAVRRVATEMECPLIDLYAAHAAEFEKKVALTRDGTHLNMAGETLSAATILKAFGLQPVWKKYQLRVTCRRNGWSTNVDGGPAGNAASVLVEPFLPAGAPELQNPKGKFSVWQDFWLANWPTPPPAYAPGTKVMLKLDPACGKTFHHWADFDGLVPKNSTATLTVIMNGHKWVDLSYEVPSGKPAAP